MWLRFRIWAYELFHSETLQTNKRTETNRDCLGPGQSGIWLQLRFWACELFHSETPLPALLSPAMLERKSISGSRWKAYLAWYCTVFHCETLQTKIAQKRTMII